VLFTLWSVKGGSGTSVVSAGLATLLTQRGREVLLVDLAGDQPALLGIPEPTGPGVGDWLGSPDGDAAALGRLEIEVADGLRLLPGDVSGAVGAERVRELVAVLRSDRRAVVVDAGGRSPDSALRSALCEEGTSVLVVRACYLALRRAVRSQVTADSAVLVVEPGRALDGTDVSRALGIPVHELDWDPTVARAVDAGLLSSRPPRGLARDLAPLAEIGESRP